MLFEPLFSNAARQPTATAVIDETSRYSYEQVAAMAAALGMYLSTQTDRPRIGLLLPAGIGFVASFYGTLLAGKTVVPINFLLGDHEVAHVIADSEIDLVLTIPQLAGRVKDSGLNIIDLTQLPKNPPKIEPTFPSPAPGDIAVLMYTSGTSGMPKGVLLSYGNLQSDVDAAIELAQLKQDHVFLGVIPLFHSFGMTAMMLAPIQLGATVVYIARFSPVATMNAIREHHVSILFGVPSMFGAIARLKSAGPDDFKSIYAMISGGEPLPANLREGFKERFGIPLLEGYGLTETSPVISLNMPQAFLPGSVGRLVPGVETRIVNDDGKSVAPGESGELWVRGPMVMQGYHKLPSETAAAISPDKFFNTGDLARLDSDGYLHITGRKKDLIIVAGEKAVPREIEEVLLRNPALSEAAVLGKKDAGRGEVVVAFVTLHEGQNITGDALRDFCRQQGLAQWKCPREVTIVPDLPKSPTGKVLKRVLAEQMQSS